MKTLIVTVGVGRTIVSGILRSIEAQNPDKVVFLFTKDSKEKHGSELIEETRKRDKQVEEEMLRTEAEADRLVIDCVRIIHRWKKEGDVCIDFTFGTKAMTAALYTAGLMTGLKSASYVEGERDPNGIVISGSERVILMSYNLPRLIILSQKVIHLYNSHYYGSALELAEEVVGLAGRLADFGRKAEALYNICSAAYAWDRFEFREAAEGVGKLLDSVEETAHLFGMDTDKATLKKHLEDMKGYLLSLDKNPMNPSLAWELLRNAERRAATKRWDDAVARLYRTMEFVGQLALSELGLFDGREYKEPPEGGLPNEIKDLLDKRMPLGLRNVYRVLFYQKHPLGRRFVGVDQLVPEFRAVLNARNKSILAHGLKPVDEEAYKRFGEVVEEAVGLAGIRDAAFTIPDIKAETLL